MAETALSTMERHLLFNEWCDTARDFSLTPLMHELVAERARLAPESVAVVDGDRRLTYGDLDARANGLARRLQALGARPETRVAILAPRSIELVLGSLAVLKAGGAYVPIDPRFPQDRLGFMLEDSRAAAVLAHPGQAPRLAESPVPVLRLDVGELPPDTAPPSAVGPENLAYVIYTSGSTGRPKGAEIEHASLSRLIRWHLETFRLTPEDRATLFSGPSFDVSVWEVWSCLAAGASLHIPDEDCRVSAPRMIRWLAGQGITHGVVSTPLAELMIGEPWPAEVALRTLTTGGDRLHQWPGAGFPCPLVNIYGPTEGTVVTTCFVLYPGAGQEGMLPPIGRPLGNIQVYLLDPDLRPVPLGEPGELWIGGGGLGRGYLERPELTAEKFMPDPFAGTPGARLYRTGDLARYLPDGNLEFLGRIDFQIKIRGFRIEPGEIEAELVALPGVREAAVLPHGGGPGGTRLVAYLAAGAQAPGTAEAREILGARLPDYMVPAAFVWLEALPLTPNGKVDRRALAALPVEFAADRLYVAPRTATEKALAEIWEEVLGVERVGIQDPFLHLGGHSLLAVQVLARVRRRLGADFPPRALFDFPTVESLASAVERELPRRRTDLAMAAGPRDRELPLSFAQRRLWFLDRLRPGTAAYNVPAAYRLRGTPRPEALGAALSEIARRHEALRTRFAEGEDGPVQVIDPPAALPLPRVDLGGLPEPVRAAETARLTRAAAARPFDLARGPLLRALLLRVDREEWVLVLALHHIVTDGWSMEVLPRELDALYRAASAGEPSPLPELPVQYADYALWQREQLSGGALEGRLAYWRERLAGHPPALELPADRPRPAVQSFRGATEPLSLGAELSERLRALSRERGAPPFMTLLAGLLALLHRYTGQSDLLVGTPAAGRGREELEGMIGFFVNTLVLRTDLAGDPSFLELMDRVRETALGAYSHADLPFERLVEELAPERDLSRSPLFQVMLAMQPATGRLTIGDLEAEELATSSETAKLDLTLFLAEQGDGISGGIEYSTDLFDAATVRRLAGHLAILLAGAVETPDVRLSELPLLSEAERAELLEWNRTAREHEWASVHELFARHARRRPEALAVSLGDLRLTYGELEARSNRLAHHLRSLGVGPDVVVGVCAERTLERVAGVVAVLKAGGAYASFDPAYPRERLAVAMEDARVPVLLTESGLLDRVPASSAVVIRLDVDLAGLEGDESSPPAVEVDPDHLAYVIFTSGSTGRPKGVAVPHRGLSNLARWHHETYGTAPEDVGTQVSSPAFDVSVWDLWMPLSAGAAQSIPDEETRLSPSRMVSWWKEEGITLAFLPTPLAEGVLAEEIPADLPMRYLAVAGDRLHRAARPGTPFALSNFYGPAEYSVATTMAIVPQGGRVTIGRPLANTRVRVLDARGLEVPVGVPGELCIAGAGLARGYLGRPELTAERFLPDPFGGPGERMYRTGDLVRRLPDGELDFLGRLDHQVKIRGMRVELGEIESVLGRYPGVREAVVLVPAGRLTAYVVGLEGTGPAVAELRGFLERQLPSYMVPQDWALLAALPLTPNGKVDRRALARLEAMKGSADQGELVAPGTPVEKGLAEIWEELLALERVGLRDNFFRLGGHSLLAVQVLSRVRRRFGVELGLRDLFSGPTVEGLAAAVERARPEKGTTLEPRPRDRELPLSFAQQRLWFLDHLTPGSPLYNVPTVYRLRGDLRPAALVAALGEITRRHEALRTRFAETETGPAQVIDPAAGFALPQVDLADLPAPARGDERERLVAAAARRPFDLARGPLLHTLLLRVEPDEWALVLVLHHIVSDGWSTGVLRRELGALYGAALAGETSPLPEPPVQYADYALWQQEWLRGEALEEQLAYWRERLAGSPPLLELPSDRPRPLARSYRGATEPVRLDARLSERLRALSREKGMPLFMPLLSGLLALLYRYTGQADLLVGTPTAGRGQVELEGLIGFFVNTLVLRTGLAGDPSFLDLMARARETALGAYSHADLPFERLVEELAPERSLDHSPLFQVAFVLQTAPGEPARLPGLEVEELALSTGTAKFDLTLALAETAGGEIAGELEYSRDLFDAATIRRLSDHLERLLSGAVAAPSARLSELPLLGAAESRMLLVEWNATAADYPRERSIHGLFAERARRDPEAVAVAASAGRISYGELDARADALAARLRAAGVGAETLVALCAERSIEWVVAMLAILKAGGAYVPLDPSYPSERLAFLLADTGAPVLLAQERLASTLPPSSARLILLEGPAEEAVEVPLIDLPDDDGGDRLAYVIYTSGSTGRPKGVAVPHRAVLRLVLGTDFLQLGPGDCVAQVANASFDAATLELWGPLLNGGSLAIIPQEVVLSPAALAAELRRYGVRAMFLTVALFSQMAREAPGAFASTGEVLFGGDAADPGAVRAVLRDGPPRRLLNGYGPTENTTFSTWFEVEALAETAATVPIGKPVANSRAYVLDTHLRPVPAGVHGSLYVGGDGLARGYLNRPELTAERFVPAPFGAEAGLAPGERLYATGDLVRQLADGNVEFLGRADQQVKIRGFRIELGEIETVLAGHPVVGEAVVLALADGTGGKRLVAYGTTPGEAPGTAEVREYLRSKLPDYMVPSAFVWLESLPLTPNGKVDRGVLARLEAKAELGGYVAPRTGVEQVLARIWEELLSRERVGVHDDFFHLGGHSLLAIQVLSRVRRLLKVELSIRSLFDSSTLETLARAVEEELEKSGRAAGMVLPERLRDQAAPLSFAQQRLWFLDRLQPGSSSYNMPMAYRLRGRLEPGLLAAALGEIVRRHEALRTRFAEGVTGPVQLIDPPVGLLLPWIDLGGLPEPVREAEMSRLTRAEASRPFDLERGPLLRPWLLRLAAGEWVLMLSMHHIVSDGWSMGVLLRELDALYRAGLAVEPSQLPELPMQYVDYALWQREQLSGEALEGQLAYWRERLAGHPPALELPAGRPRPAAQSFRGATEPLGLGAELSERLRALSRERSTPLFMTLLSGFLALLHRYTGQSDLLVGTPTAGRGREELERLIGFFVNTLVLRADLAGDPSFLELMERARQTALGAYAHADLPFERLVEELAPERDLSRSPLFQMMFSLQPETSRSVIGGLEVEELAASSETAKFDLTLFLAERAGEIAGGIEYSVDLFDAATIRRLARHLAILLAGAVETPGIRLSELPLLSAAERTELLEWNDTARKYEWAPVHELFARHARRRPEALAVSLGDRRLPYGELEARSNRLAHHLRSLGVGPDVVVGVCAERTLERVIGIVAVLKAGGAYASFDPAYPRERLAVAMEDARVPVLLTESGLLDRVPVSSARVIRLDIDLAGLEGDEFSPPAVEVAPDHLAYVIFTSGSTGRPKGVAVPHRGLSNLARWHHETYGTKPEDVGTQVSSPAFDVSVWDLWMPLAAGAAQSIPDEETRLSSSRMVEWWRREGITLAFLPTPLAEGVLAEEIPADLPMRYLAVAGDRLHRSARPGTPFALSNFYGPAEYSVATTMAIVPAGGPVTIGRPLANTRVHVLDAQGAPVPVGAPGELYIAGEGLARGYLGRPDLTAERFLPDPFGEPGERMYRTGDLVRRLPDGELDFLGRLDHQVKIRGMRVELGEIESLLGRFPGVREAVVLVPEGRLTAYVVAREGTVLAVAELRGFLESQLPSYMVPRDWALLAALPLTPNGKVDRRALARLETRETSGQQDRYMAPQTETEERLASLWAELLGVERVGIRDDFFRLGGHSLLAVQVLSRVRRQLGAELSVRALFSAPTVEGLAAAIDRLHPERKTEPALTRRSRDRELPLSFAQQRLWFLDRLAPGSALYNVPMAYRLRGYLRPAALTRALGEIVGRHESLRTRFAEGGDGPVQVIEPAAGCPLPQVDLTGLPEPARGEERERLVSATASRPFDLARGPLLRALLLRFAPEEWVLMLAMHHIVSDGWSMGVMLREIGALYGAALAGEPSPLPELPVQYADYALWQQERFQGEALEEQLAYWRRRLAGHPPLLELPADRPRPAVQSYRGASEPVRLGARLAERLRALSRERGAPLFMTLLSGFLALLHRYTGQSDLLVGTPMAGRGQVELEGLIGFFINTLVLRADLSGDPSFLELLDRARETALGAYSHADLPFDRLVEELAPERALDHSPLFQVAFVFQTAPGGPPRWPGLEIEEMALSTGTSKFDLTLALAETADGSLAGEVEYNLDLFDPATARRLLDHLEILLAGTVAEPSARLSELPLLSAAERRMLLADWNATDAGYPRGSSIHGLFAERARQAPEVVAVIASAERISYGELDARADVLASRLRAAGVVAETLVGLCAERSIEWVVAMLAILKAGGAYVPLDPSYPSERLAFLLADTGAPVLLAQERLASTLPAGEARLILLDGPAEAVVEAPPLDEVGGDHLAYVIYTSGSTGKPKGVAVSHRAVLRLVLNTDYLQLAPGDRVAQVANASFDAATFELWGPLLNGGSLAIFPQEVVLSPAALAADLRRHRIHSMFLTTALLNQMAREAPGAFAPLDAVLFGGEAVDPGAVRAVLRDGPPRRLLHVYGPTESTTFSTWHAVGSLAEEAATVPIGKPIANTRAYVLDPHLRPVPVGVHGSLYLGGEGLARGYLNRPELTAERFVPAPFGVEAGLAPGSRLYATGDLVRQLADGAVEFLGRADQQVKIRGFRIELGEIEAALAGHPAVGEAAVLALADGAGGKRLAAYLTASGEAPAAAEIRDHLRSRLPDYMIPSAFVWLESLPLTPNGKVDRGALARLEARAELSEHVAPRTGAEQALAEVWAELLGVERVGVHDDFFHLGGHSLLAVRVLSRVRRLFGVEVSVRALFESSTLEALARAVEGALEGSDRAAAMAPPERPGALPLSFAQQRLWFLDHLQPGSSSYNMPMAYRLRGPLAPAALAGALGEIVRRHEALRTRFAESAAGPVQVIDPAAPLVLPRIDLGGLPEPLRSAEEARLTQAEALRPFDLERGPLLRPLLLRLAAGEWVLMLPMHHVVSDGWSMGVMLRELGVLYDALRAGEPSPLPELPLQYADFALWQRRWLQGETLERSLSYWREQLAGHPPALELPTDRPRPALPALRGATVPVRLERDLSARLLAASRRQGVSPFMTTLAGFLALLHRYTGQTDLVVGTPAAGRSRVELEGLIGFFINTLALRIDAAGDPTFAALLGRARETALEAYAHAELPLERIVEELAPERSLSHSPLFQVIFELHAAPLEPPAMAGIEISDLPLSNGAAKLDLTLGLAETPEGIIAGDLEYDRELFDPATARRMAGHLRTLLAGAVTRPDVRLSELPLLSDTERAELLEWNDTAREYEGAPVHELFARHARRRPEALAVESGERRLTYGELEARSNRLAHHLQSLGVGPDVVVGVCAERTLERVVGIVAALKAGGAYASFDPAYPRERLAVAMEDARVPVLLTESGLLDRVPASSAVVIRLDRDLDDLTGDELRPPAVEVDPDNLAYVIFTSGSTGRPKGVAVPHRGLSNLVRWHHETYAMTPEDVGTQVASPAFDVSVWELWPLLAAGAAQSIPDGETRLSPSRMVSWWKEAGITLAFLPTPLADGILSEEVPADLPVRYLVVGGDRLHRSPRPGTPFRLSNIYGPAEHSVVTTMAIVPPEGRVTIGRALANTRVHVLDARGVPVPVGVPGELYVAGAGLARGYLWRPELTAERFLPDPFASADRPGERMYRTGDLVRRLLDGDFDFLGRLDHQVKIRGIRVELGEIESVLGRRAREAVVLVVEGRLTAYVAGLVGEAPSIEGLRGFLEAQLPSYMVPQDWALLAAMPLTPNGKIDRQALAQIEGVRGTSSSDGENGYVAPRTAVEERLAELWTELLGLERVGIHDNFFALGGHSLLAVQLLSRARRLFAVELELRDLFNDPTVEALARTVERSPAAEAGARTGPLPAATGSRQGELPLSFAQQRLWFLERLQPGTATYNMPMAYRLRAAVRPAALAAALGEIVRRHDALRARFRETEDGPVQVIGPAAGFRLPWIDLAGLPEPAREAERERLTAGEATRPFDLETGPLLRPLLLGLAPRDWVLMLSMHHIVSDGWSMGVLLRELDALYNAALEERPSPLPEPPMQYTDYAVWQRDWLRGRLLDEQLAYWRTRLAGHPPLLELPADHPRPMTQSFRGATEPLYLDAELAERLRELGRRGGTPLFIVLLSGFVALLHRYTGETDLLVGTPTAGRGRVELEGLIGFFVNTLVLRTDAAGDPPYLELLGRARETSLGAFAHADLPFERLVEELAPERDLSRSPLFQVMVTLQSATAGAPVIAGLEVEEISLTPPSAKFDLTLGLAETGGEIAGEIGYGRDLFEAATIRRLCRHLERLFAGIAADPSARLSELPLLSPEERRALLVEWNATRAPFPGEGSIHGLFTERARQAPEAVAVIASAERITYGELAARADALAARLRAAGVGPETLVALCAERSIDWVVAMLAILKAGGAYVPLDPSYPAERLAFLLADTGAPVLLTQERLAAILPADGVRVILLDRPDEAPAREAAPPEPDDRAGGERLAYVIYTSGSTGRPKGVMVSHRAVLRLVLGTDFLQLAPGDRVAQAANASFDAATFEVWGPLLNGGTLAIIPQEVVLSPAALAAELRRHGVRKMFLTTALLNQMAREAPGAFAALDDVLFGGEAVDPGAVRAVLRDGRPQRLLHVYGPTESTTFSTWFEIGALAETATTVPIGKPIANTRAYVLDAHLRPVPVGARGSLYLGGEGLARGYLNRPGLTAERFVPAPFGADAGLAPGERLYATGDLVRRLADGDVEFLGRADQQVKIRGFRIEPGEIEAVLAGHPAVGEAVVLALADGSGGKRLVAYAAVSGAAPPAAEMRDYLRAKLPDYMVPSVFVWLESLPLTPNGKVDRKALARHEVKAEAAERVAPRTEVEEALAEVFRQVFGLETVGVHDDFFALGGHSLLATQVVSRVRRLLGIDLEIRVLFEEPTIEQLARHIELAGYRRAGGAGGAAVPLGGSAGTSDHESSFSPPRTPLEELVAEIWGEVLGLDRVGLHDNFWDLGGRSALAAEVLARVGDSFGVELPPQTLYESPTIAAFTAAIGEALLADEAGDLEPIGMGEA